MLVWIFFPLRCHPWLPPQVPHPCACPALSACICCGSCHSDLKQSAQFPASLIRTQLLKMWSQHHSYQNHWGCLLKIQICWLFPRLNQRGIGVKRVLVSFLGDSYTLYGLKMLPNKSSLAQHTMRSNEPKHWGLGQRKVHCKAKQGWGGSCPRESRTPRKVSAKRIQSPGKGGGPQGTWSACAQLSDWLMLREQGGQHCQPLCTRRSGGYMFLIIKEFISSLWWWF